MNQYIITIFKNKKVFDEIIFFTDDPIEAFEKTYNTYLRYDLTCKGPYTIILSLYVENDKNEVLVKLSNRTKGGKKMKAPKEQVIEYVEKRYQKEKDKWDSGLINQYFEWEDVRNQLFQEQDNTHLYERIIELENKLKHIREKYGINE